MLRTFNTAHLYMTDNDDNLLWLCIRPTSRPHELVSENTDNENLDKAVAEFKQKWEVCHA
jgi:hypothetical protein